MKTVMTVAAFAPGKLEADKKEFVESLEYNWMIETEANGPIWITVLEKEMCHSITIETSMVKPLYQALRRAMELRIANGEPEHVFTTGVQPSDLTVALPVDPKKRN